MPRTVEVFTPNDQPTYTYVERAEHKFEDRLRDALEVPKMIVSLSGPSKSGKTVLFNKVIDPDDLIFVSGASIRTADALWAKVLAWMDVPAQRVETKGSKVGAKVAGTIGGERSRATTETYQPTGLDQVGKEISGSSFVVFIDDFHYIARNVQKEVGQQLKEAAERNVRICTASVPHRSDDVVRSNAELTGRVTAIDTEYWKDRELQMIANRGFNELNMDVSPAVVSNLSAEAFGSPQLMQAICLNFCLEVDIKETLPKQQRIELDFVTQQNLLERTSTTTDFSSLIAKLHSGPRQRGVERKEFSLADGSKGDVYRCVLLAIKADPPRLSFTYDDILQRIKGVSVGESPVGSSVAQSLAQMDQIAEAIQDERIIEWEGDVLDIVEPYFLFFLRNSQYLRKLG